jgi:hypothetical protein
VLCARRHARALLAVGSLGDCIDLQHVPWPELAGPESIRKGL